MQILGNIIIDIMILNNHTDFRLWQRSGDIEKYPLMFDNSSKDREILENIPLCFLESFFKEKIIK